MSDHFSIFNFQIIIIAAEEMVGTEFYGIIYTAVGVILAILFTTESPLRLIQKGRENKALEAMSDLRTGIPEEDDEVIAAFHELKVMLEEEKNQQWWEIFHRNNMFPLIFVFALKLSFFLSFNFLINEVLADDFHLQSDKYDFSSLFLIGMRLIGIVIVMFTIDKKRRWHVIGIIGSAVSALILCGLVFAPYDEVRPAVYVFTTLFEISSGIGIGVLGEVYASEVFSTTRRPLSISLVVAVESILQYAVYEFGTGLEITSELKSIVYGISGVLLALIASFTLFFAPETAKLSLRDSRDVSKDLTPRHR